MGNEQEQVVLSKEHAMEICNVLELTSEFFEEGNEENILIREYYPSLLEAFEQLFTIAYAE